MHFLCCWYVSRKRRQCLRAKVAWVCVRSLKSELCLKLSEMDHQFDIKKIGKTYSLKARNAYMRD